MVPGSTKKSSELKQQEKVPAAFCLVVKLMSEIKLMSYGYVILDLNVIFYESDDQRIVMLKDIHIRLSI